MPAAKRNAKMRAVDRTKGASKDDSELGDSWMVDDDEQDDEVSFEEGEDSETERSPPTPSAKRRTSSKVHTGTAESVIAPEYSGRSSEFRMPVLEHSSPPRERRRRAVNRSGKPAASPRQKKTQRPEQNEDNDISTMLRGFAFYLGHGLLFGLDVVLRALSYLKGPLAFILAMYFLVGIMTVLGNLATQSINNALSPICRVPGVSFLKLSFCENNAAAKWGPEPPPPEFDRLMNSQSKFEEILSNSAVGVTLPADMKRSETAIRDLRTLVRYSSLKSRHELALEFDGFVETARMASADLQRFNAHTGRAADSIISTARWTMRTLDDVTERDASRGALVAFVSDTLLAPFQPSKLTPALVLDQYVAHTQKVEQEIQRLLEEAQALLLILQNLEDRLDLIHDITTRDEKLAGVARDEVLGKIWTILGMNGPELKKFESQLQLLRDVNGYRSAAWAHVSTTFLKLQAMNAELEELRERVGSTELLQDRKDLPLQVHLQAIELGVERLQIGRSDMRKAEADYYDRAMIRGAEDVYEATAKGRLIDS